MLDETSTWSVYSGKQSYLAERMFMVIHHPEFHGSEGKVVTSDMKIPEGERIVWEKNYFPMEVNAT